MSDRESGQGGGGATSSSYASFKNQTAAFGNAQPATQDAAPSKPTTAADIKDKVTDDLRSVQQKAQDGLADVSDKAKDAASEQKNMVADKVSGIAAAMEKVGHELEQGDQADIGRMTRNLSTTLRTFSEDIKDRDLGQIAGMAEDFGRRQPLAFLGAAAVAGLAASRFLSASAARHGSAKSPSASRPQENSTAAKPFSTYAPAGSVKTEDKING